MQRLGYLAVVCALSSACASTGAVPRPFPSPASRSTPPPAATPVPTPPAAESGVITAAEALGYRVAATALEFRGVPYRNGGADPSGFDCSGLVAYVFTRYGRELPRVTHLQFTVGRPIDRGALRAGDLVFFSTVAPGASHVGIALDDDEFVHAPNSNGVVRVDRLTASYWRSRYIGARRIG
jgi:cell wall-associated NlpC family hydrolase